MIYDHLTDELIVNDEGRQPVITEMTERGGRLHLTVRFGDLFLSDVYDLNPVFDGQTSSDRMLEIVRDEIAFIERAVRISRDPTAYSFDFTPDSEHPLEVVRDRDEALVTIVELSETLDRERSAHAQLEAGYLAEITHLHRRIEALERSDDEVEFLAHLIASDAGRTPARQ